MTNKETQIIKEAISILDKALFNREHLTSPEMVSNYLRLNLEVLDREGFFVLFLDNQLGVIKSEMLFKGTINSSEVHPRVIAKEALLVNANGVILAHNHPSGCTEPSPSDRHITDKIQGSLALLDIRVIDHFIVANGDLYSFAEHGLI
jgi:DNA repair protein RadC